MIQNEVITSHKKNVEIEWIWNDLEEKEDCEELAKVYCFSYITVIRTSTSRKTHAPRSLSRRSVSSASSWSS
jgi:hypothetical protein